MTLTRQREDVRTYILDQLKEEKSWLKHQIKLEEELKKLEEELKKLDRFGHYINKEKLEEDKEKLEEDSFYCNFEGSELPNRFLNTNYFIIGTWKAKKWLGEELCEAVQTIQEYERDNFGETFTDITNPEEIANTLSYILGNEILSDSVALQLRWDSAVNRNTLEIMINELEGKRELAKI